MTTFEQILLREVSTLPEDKQADVLAFIRFLKVSMPDRETVKKELLAALAEARAIAKENNITQEDIEAEIRAVRNEK
jgi:tRNA A-37 threonylcarbamoyl transferase component Bud32